MQSSDWTTEAGFHELSGVFLSTTLIVLGERNQGQVTSNNVVGNGSAKRQRQEQNLR